MTCKNKIRLRYVAHFQQAAAQMHVRVAQDVETCVLLCVLERRSARSDVRVAQNVFETWVLLCVLELGRHEMT